MAIEKSLVNKQWDPFLAMDRLDDQAIIAELQGQTVKALVYEFKQNGQLVTGLSKAGVDAVVREMAKQGEVLREMELNVLETPDEFVAQVKAGRYVIQTNQQTGEVKETLLDVVFGVKRQPKKHPSGTPNPFAYEQAVSKAARNAKMRLLREDLKQTIIALARKEGRVKEVKPETVDAEPVDSSAKAKPAPKPAKDTQEDASGAITPAQKDAILKLAGQLVPGDDDARAQWLFAHYGLDLANATREQAGDVIQKLQWAIKHKGGNAQAQAQQAMM